MGVGRGAPYQKPPPHPRPFRAGFRLARIIRPKLQTPNPKPSRGSGVALSVVYFADTEITISGSSTFCQRKRDRGKGRETERGPFIEERERERASERARETDRQTDRNGKRRRERRRQIKGRTVRVHVPGTLVPVGPIMIPGIGTGAPRS